MAEGPNTKSSYETRSRKRARECFSNSENPVLIVGSETVEEKAVIDLTEENETDNTSSLDANVSKPDCAICLQTCIHPTRLPCGHIFCFLCVKGAAHGNKKCAMCRTPIPHNYFNNPDLLETPEELAKKPHEGHEWFYEGRHGWWQYDPRATRDIEFAWESGIEQCELLIAGFIYVIDFKEMYQYRKCQPTKRRKIKRDLASSQKLGIAGLRDHNVPHSRRHSEGDKGPCAGDELDTPLTSGAPRRASFDSTQWTFFDFLEDQFSDLTIRSDEDDDGYQ